MTKSKQPMTTRKTPPGFTAINNEDTAFDPFARGGTTPRNNSSPGKVPNSAKRTFDRHQSDDTGLASPFRKNVRVQNGKSKSPSAIDTQQGNGMTYGPFIENGDSVDTPTKRSRIDKSNASSSTPPPTSAKKAPTTATPRSAIHAATVASMKTIRGIPIPTSKEEASPADLMLLKRRDEGMSWREITAEWNQMTSQNLGNSTLPNRYIRMMAMWSVWKEGDVERMLRAKAIVEHSISQELEAIKKYKLQQIWARTAQVMVEIGAESYSNMSIQKAYLKEREAGFPHRENVENVVPLADIADVIARHKQASNEEVRRRYWEYETIVGPSTHQTVEGNGDDDQHEE